MGISGQHHAAVALPPEKSRYPSYRRLGGHQGRLGHVHSIIETGLHLLLRLRMCEVSAPFLNFFMTCLSTQLSHFPLTTKLCQNVSQISYDLNSLH